MPPRPSSSLSQSPTSIFSSGWDWPVHFRASISCRATTSSWAGVCFLGCTIDHLAVAPPQYMAFIRRICNQSHDCHPHSRAFSSHWAAVSSDHPPSPSATSDSWLMSSASKVLPWGRAIGSNSTTGRWKVSEAQQRNDLTKFHKWPGRWSIMVFSATPVKTQRQWPRVQAPQPHLPHRWRRACLACQAQAINKPSCPLTLLIYDVQPPTHQHMLGHRLIELWYHILSEQGICNILFAFPDQDAPASCIGCSLLAQLHALVDLPELTLCPPRKRVPRGTAAPDDPSKVRCARVELLAFQALPFLNHLLHWFIHVWIGRCHKRPHQVFLHLCPHLWTSDVVPQRSHHCNYLLIH